MEVLRELNARALELQRRDAGREDATRRLNFGLYLFNEDQLAPDEETEE